MVYLNTTVRGNVLTRKLEFRARLSMRKVHLRVNYMELPDILGFSLFKYFKTYYSSRGYTVCATVGLCE